ncbi:XRE family transcriptional regulator [Streptomyces sp. NBC_00299]|uniref:XRE family transcriptional regulator n=1 Tax=Streptomyces sp. NBC_00299 TaxID=2975705 RepID=UPI003FA79206
MTILPPDPDLNALRLELARLRAARKWSYDEVAARSGLARRTVIEIAAVRSGAARPSRAAAHQLLGPGGPSVRAHRPVGPRR